MHSHHPILFNALIAQFCLMHSSLRFGWCCKASLSKHKRRKVIKHLDSIQSISHKNQIPSRHLNLSHLKASSLQVPNIYFIHSVVMHSNSTASTITLNSWTIQHWNLLFYVWAQLISLIWIAFISQWIQVQSYISTCMANPPCKDKPIRNHQSYLSIFLNQLNSPYSIICSIASLSSSNVLSLKEPWLLSII